MRVAAWAPPTDQLRTGDRPAGARRLRRPAPMSSACGTAFEDHRDQIVPAATQYVPAGVAGGELVRRPGTPPRHRFVAHSRHRYESVRPGSQTARPILVRAEIAESMAHLAEPVAMVGPGGRRHRSTTRGPLLPLTVIETGPGHGCCSPARTPLLWSRHRPGTGTGWARTGPIRSARSSTPAASGAECSRRCRGQSP